jgi:hypothetical protein
MKGGQSREVGSKESHTQGGGGGTKRGECKGSPYVREERRGGGELDDVSFPNAFLEVRVEVLEELLED